MNNETWRDVIGYEGLYQVSNLGRVKSLYREFWCGKGYNILKKYPEAILTVWLDNGGYEYVTFTRNAKSKKFKVHRLVGEAFILNPDNKPQIDHIDTIRTNNRVENLRWVTRRENNLNPITRKRYSDTKMGDKNPIKKVKRMVLQIDLKTNEVIKIWDSAVDAAKGIGANCSNIYRVIYGEKNTCRGYIWKYAD